MVLFTTVMMYICGHLLPILDDFAVGKAVLFLLRQSRVHKLYDILVVSCFSCYFAEILQGENRLIYEE